MTSHNMTSHKVVLTLLQLLSNAMLLSCLNFHRPCFIQNLSELQTFADINFFLISQQGFSLHKGAAIDSDSHKLQIPLIDQCTELGFPSRIPFFIMEPVHSKDSDLSPDPHSLLLGFDATETTPKGCHGECQRLSFYLNNEI